MGGFNCHSESSFCNLLHAILLKAYAWRQFQDYKINQNYYNRERDTNSTRNQRHARETLREGAEELVMAERDGEKERERRSAVWAPLLFFFFFSFWYRLLYSSLHLNITLFFFTFLRQKYYIKITIIIFFFHLNILYYKSWVLQNWQKRRQNPRLHKKSGTKNPKTRSRNRGNNPRGN